MAELNEWELQAQQAQVAEMDAEIGALAAKGEAESDAFKALIDKRNQEHSAWAKALHDSRPERALDNIAEAPAAAEQEPAAQQAE